MKNQRRIYFVVPLAAMAVAVTIASTAWACTISFGQTYINGQVSGYSVARGGAIQNITAKDVPGAPPNDGTVWQAKAGTGGCCSNFNITLGSASSLNRGDTDGWPLGPVTNAIAPAKGLYKVCFLYSGYATQYAAMTVN